MFPNGYLQENSSNSIPWGLCPSVLSLTVSHNRPLLPPGDPPRPTGRSDQGSYGVTAFPWVPVHVRTFVHLPRVESLFPPSPVVLLKPHWLQSQIALEAPNARPSAWEAWHEAQNSFLWEDLCNSYFLVCGMPIWWVWDLNMP